MNDRSISRGNRQSGIELLRIFAAIGVIFQHYNSPHIGGAIRFASQDSGKMFVLTITHVIMICAVDLFILITGDFMRDKKRRDLLKPITLLSHINLFRLLRDPAGDSGKHGTADRVYPYQRGMHVSGELDPVYALFSDNTSAAQPDFSTLEAWTDLFCWVKDAGMNRETGGGPYENV